jgi:hypothetical protein
MASLYLKFEEIEDLFRAVVCTILSIPETDNKSVRFPYGTKPETGTAPGFTRDQDVCFIYVIPVDDGYGQQHHITYVPDEDPASDLLTRIDKHTDIYDVRFTLYGPNSFVRARSIKDGLYRDDIRRLLKQSGFHLKAGIPPVVYLRENRESEWWWRHDITPTFYSAVRIETPGFLGPIEEAHITLKN